MGKLDNVVPTPATVYHKLDDLKGEPVDIMAKTDLFLASEPAEKANCRVTCSEQTLKEFDWIDQGRGADLNELVQATRRYDR